jgi:hypothetical protein
VVENWNMAKSHMPPWVVFDGKVPKLCNEFRLRIELSGRGHTEKKPRVTAPTALCALFSNMIVFCKATFVTPDETAADKASDATSLGFIFLENLKPESMNHGVGPRFLSFSLNVSSNDVFTFIPNDVVSTLNVWQTALKAILNGDVTADNETFIQVLPSSNVI